MKKKLTYVDLFAGCGGLSLGLEQAGFSLELAVEKSPMAAETFYHNFIKRITDVNEFERFAAPENPVQEQAKSRLAVKELSAVLGCKPLLKRLRAESIDLVAGGPPCQGFSLAGRRNPNDARNELPWQFLEFVSAVQPKAVLIENVSGMSQNFRKHGKKSPFDQLRLALTETGPEYKVQPVLLNAMHFGVPQHRPRVMLLALRKDIADRLGYSFFEKTWRSEYDHLESKGFDCRPQLAPLASHFGDDILTVADAISDLNGKGYRRITNLSEFAREMRDNVSEIPVRAPELKNHKLRSHAPHIQTRFRLYQYFRDEEINPRILGIPKSDGLSTDELRQQVSEALDQPRLPAKAPDGSIVAETQSELVDLVMSLATKKHSQRPLSWTAPSPTVVSLPDDYVHPSEARTLTVREMARFQSFPDSFEFRAKETTGSLRRRFEVPQYTQVGNAVPPKMAKAVGLALKVALSRASTCIEMEQVD